MALPDVKYRQRETENSTSILYPDGSKMELVWLKQEKNLAIAHYPADSDEADRQVMLKLPEAKELKWFLNLPEMQDALA